MVVADKTLRLLYEAAIEGVAKSSHPRHRMGAILTKNGKIKISGVNFKKTHPKSNSEFKMIHAEFDAIRKAIAQGINPKGSTIYVSRISKNGAFGLAKPCKYCRKMLEGFGVKKIVWSTPHGPAESLL